MMTTCSNRKRCREDTELSNDNSDYPAPKKQRLQSKQEINNYNKNKNEEIQQYDNIEIEDCKVTFTATQPVKNIDGVFKWETKLNHHYYQENKEAILAKSCFSVINIEKLSNYEELNGLYDVIDHNEFFHEILYIETVEVREVFRGFDYELCLVQRIIDSHARSVDIVIIKYNDSSKHICKNMGFSQMNETVYWSRNESLNNPSIHDFCATKQQITNSILSNQYHEETEEKEEKEEKVDDHKMDNIDMNSCFVTLSSEQNATNKILEEDFTSLWSAQLKYRLSSQKIVTLASASFWFVHLVRLLNYGWYHDIFTVFDAPCQALHDLFDSVVSTDCLDGTFKLHKDDWINCWKVRTEKELRVKLENEVGIDQIEGILSMRFQEMNEGGGGNIVYLDRVQVNPKYNGNGYGRCLTQKIIDNFGRGFDGIVLKPFPLQWESKSYQQEQDRKLFQKDKKKVIDVWESMWFYQFGGPNSEYWGRSAAWIHPKMEEFCKCFQPKT